MRRFNSHTRTAARSNRRVRSSRLTEAGDEGSVSTTFDSGAAPCFLGPFARFDSGEADLFFFPRPLPDESNCGIMLRLSFAAPPKLTKAERVERWLVDR